MNLSKTMSLYLCLVFYLEKGHKQSTCLNKNDFLNKLYQFKLTTNKDLNGSIFLS